jgi:glutathione S-transferase
MKLYILQGCPFGHRAAIALGEKQLAFETVLFERGKRPPELEALSPYAKSPTLFDAETKVYDSSVVLEYLEDRYPEPRLTPETAAGRALVRMFIARFNEELSPKFGRMIAEVLFNPQRDEQKIAEAKSAFLDALPAFDRHLEGRTFAVSDALTLADITLYTIFPAARTAASVEVPSELKNLRAWLERMDARPTTKFPTPS